MAVTLPAIFSAKTSGSWFEFSGLAVKDLKTRCTNINVSEIIENRIKVRHIKREIHRPLLTFHTFTHSVLMEAPVFL